MTSEAAQPGQAQWVAEVIERESARLRRFIARQVPTESEIEDVLQDVFFELIEADRLTRPIERVGGWLMRVARNRIIDLFRRKRHESLDAPRVADDGTPIRLDDWLPSLDAGPDAIFARNVLLDDLTDALAELPEEQREVFVATEIDGRSYREIAATTGVGVNTLLSRKRYAVLRLRRRLEQVYAEYRRR